MAAIKSFTDLEQSKKLAEILPLESADMYYWLAWRGDVSKEVRNTPKIGKPNKDAIKTYWCPCWSLASLLSVLSNPSLYKTYTGWRCDTYNENYTNYLLGDIVDNPVDACVTMIEKLHELNLL